MERQHALSLQQVALQRSWLTWLWRAFLDFGILLCTGISCCDAKEALLQAFSEGDQAAAQQSLMRKADAWNACCACRGREVWFLKRAQIFAGDVWGTFQVGSGLDSTILPLDTLAQCWVGCDSFKSMLASQVRRATARKVHKSFL